MEKNGKTFMLIILMMLKMMLKKKKKNLMPKLYGENKSYYHKHIK